MERAPSEYLGFQQEAANENTSSDRLSELARVSTDLARLVAKNPSAPPELLQDLSTNRDAATRSHVVANPNTPTEVLLKLGAQFPEQLLDNPIFPLLLLENPNLVDEIPPATLRSILKQDQVPESFLEHAANQRDREVLLAVVMNAKTSKAVLEKLLRSQHAAVAEAAKLHVNWAGELTQGWNEAAREAIKATALDERDWEYLEGFAKIGLHLELIFEQLEQIAFNNLIRSLERNPGQQSTFNDRISWEKPNLPEDRYYHRLLQAIAISAKTPASILERLAKDNSSDIRAAVARNPNTPAHLLEQLAVEDTFACQFAVAHPNMPVNLLDEWAKHKDKTVRYAVARNPNVPARLLEQWAKHVDRHTGAGIAKLPETPATILEQLAKHEKIAIRIAVATNPNTPVPLLEQLAGREDIRFRAAVAQNPNAPPSLLEQLAKDEEVQVRQSVAQNPNIPGSILLGQLAKDAEIREVIADRISGNDRAIATRVCTLLTEHYNTCDRLLEELARHERGNVRYFVASLPDVPLHILEQLSRDDNWIVCQAVAQNPHTPENLLQQLAKDDDWMIREAVARNPNTPTSLLEQLFEDVEESVGNVAVAKYLARNPEGLPVVLQGYVKDSTPFFSRFLVLLHPQTPSEALAIRYRSSAWLERYAVAQNPNTPTDAIAILVKDGNRIVRAAARANLERRSQQP